MCKARQTIPPAGFFSQKITQFNEKKPAGGIVWRALHIHRRRKPAKSEIGVTVVVAHVYGGAGMQRIREENISRKLLSGRERSVRVIGAAETSLHVEELCVSDGCVVIQNQAQRQFFCELIIQFCAIKVIIEDTLPG